MRRLCRRSAVPQCLLTLVALVLLRTVRAGSECQVYMEALPGLYDSVTFTAYSISCQGDEVLFKIPTSDYAYYFGLEVTGSVLTEEDPELYDALELAYGEDVTFTSVVVTNHDFLDEYALSISNCRGCTFRNALFDGLAFTQVDGGGFPLRIRNSSVTIDGAVFTNLGWLEPAGSRGAISAAESNITMKNTVITNTALNPSSQGVLSLEGGRLQAEGSSWLNLTLPAGRGSVLAASNGAEVALRGCTLSGIEEGEALIRLGSGASLDLAPDNSLYLYVDAAGGPDAVIVSDHGGAISWPDEAVLKGGTSEAPQPVPVETAWARSLVVLIGQDAATPLQLPGKGSVALQVRGGSFLELADVALLRLQVQEGSTATVRNVSFTGLMPGRRLQGPSLEFTTSSRGSVSHCTFPGVSVYGDVPAAIVLDVIGSDVHVADCAFEQISWALEADGSNSPESQVVRVTAGGSLHIRNSSFSGIGGCGTAIRADGGSDVVLEGVNVTDIDLSSATGERRAALVVAEGSSLTARRSVWSRINVGASSSGAALDAGDAGAITLDGCNFTDVFVPESPVVQIQRPARNVSVVGCGWRNVTATYGLWLASTAASAVVSGSGFWGCRCGSPRDEFRAPMGLVNCTGGGPVLLSGLEFSSNSGQTGGALLVSQCGVSIRDSTFRSNEGGPRGGGAIYAQEGSALQLSATIFISNRASGGYGGAIYADSNTRLGLRSCTFVSNGAARLRGGALAVLDGALSVADDSTFTRNTAARGGAVYCRGTDATLSGSTFFANVADEYGGAVLMTTTATTMTMTSGGGGSLTLQDAVLTGNSALRGGGLCVDCDVTDAASVLASGVSRIPFDASADAASRAGLLLALEAAFRSATVRINGSTFASNACTGDADAGAGGAAHVNGRVFVNGSSFVGNNCPSGGALAFGMTRPSDWVAVAQSIFRVNHGTNRGGAVCLLDTNTPLYAFFFENSFRANNARLFGGAINARKGWAIDLLSNNFTANGNGETSLDGGAAFLAGCRSLQTDQGGLPNVLSWHNKFVGNTGIRGGALYIGACNFTALGDRYVGNRADGGGGAVLAVNTDQEPVSTLQLYEVYAEANHAQSSGGAVLTSQQGVSVANSVFINNSAQIAGGALLVMEASPSALLVLQRDTDPYYSDAEHDFLRAIVLNTTFEGNTASSGGGAIYSDSSSLRVTDSKFVGNVAGDGIPNDEWSDSGGAISAVACFGLSEVSDSNFTGNRASGGPGGAILHTACSFLLTNSSFGCNAASTFGGAVAAGNRRNENSTAYSTPTLTALSCNFTDNHAQLYDGGALLARDMNASAFVSVFRRNQAGRNGGAVAFLDNLGSGLRSCTLEANRATQYGGAAYAAMNSLLSVEDSDFRDNFALLDGGALSSVGSTCVLMGRSTFVGNYAGVSGGALQLQPAMSTPSGESSATANGSNFPAEGASNGTAAAATAGTCAAQLSMVNYLQGSDTGVPCVSHFLRQVNALASTRGRELLGLTEAATLSYNATLAHAAGAGGGGGTASPSYYFGRGGVLLPTPRVSGPAQFFGYDITVVPQPVSVVELAPGGALARANWEQLRLQADANGTRLIFLEDRLDDVRVEGAVVELDRGSAITRLGANVAMLPAGIELFVSGSALFVGADLVSYTPSGGLPALSTVLSYRASVAPNGGGGGAPVLVGDWNRWVLRSSAAGSVLLDALTGATRELGSGGARAAVANGSPLVGHSNDSIALVAPGSGDISVLSGGRWRLGNGTTVATGGSRPAASAVPAADSSVELAADSSLSVESWLPYAVRWQSGVTRLEYLSRGVGVELRTGVVVSLPAGSVVLTPADGARILARDEVLTTQGSNWARDTGSGSGSGTAATTEGVGMLSPGSGDIAMGIVLPAGSTVEIPDNSSSLFVRDWNRYVLWAGPTGTVLYDTDRGSATMLPDMSTVSISRGTPYTRYDGTAVLSTGLELNVSGAATWALGNGTAVTTASLSPSTVALTAILAKSCIVTTVNGTSTTLNDWYRYLLVASRAGTYLYDTASEISTPLAAGTRVTLMRGSTLLHHDSFASVLTSDSKLAVQGGRLRIGDRTLPDDESPSGAVRQVVVLPAEGSRLLYDGNGGGGGRLTVTLGGSDAPSRYVPWVGVNGSYMYDTVLLATFTLAPGSALRLAAGSSLMVHDSFTTVLSSRTNLTASPGGVWALSNGTTLTVRGGVTGLSASPTGASRILYGNLSLSIVVNDWQRYSLQAGRNGTTLYDARIDASYQLADGSRLSLSASSLSYVRNGVPSPYGTPVNLTVQSGGRRWLLNDGSVLDPGDGAGSSDEFEARLHTASIDRLPDELGRLCSVDLTTATYVADPYSYNAAAAQAYLSSLTEADFTQPSIYGRFARLAYDYGADVDVSGFNASLLLPPTAANWDPLGRPSSAVVKCAVTTAPEPTLRARGVGMLLINLTMVNNTAGSAGGAIYFDGGQGSVLMDSFKVENNTVLNGDGGGLALYQGDDQRDMKLQIFIVSSRFAANNASTGTGGAVSLLASKLHQQVVFLNTTLDGNSASAGGGLALSRRVSVLLNESLLESNRADVAGVAAAAAASSESSNYGDGGGIMASGCNELQLTSGTRLRRNTATGRGGGLAAYACALVLLNDTAVEGNAAQSAGGVYTWSDLLAVPVTVAGGGGGGSGSASSGEREGDVGGSIAVVIRSTILNNTAVDGNATDDRLEGIGGGFLLRGRVSTLLADSYFEDNTADSQGGSIFIESMCDLNANSTFLVSKAEAPTAFPSAAALLPGTVSGLQWPRPKGCWGTVVYLPRFYNNEAARSGGALFSSHPEALSLVCDPNAGSGSGSPFALALNYTAFNESALAEQVLMAMKKASYQVLDNRIVQSCYREEIQRIYNRSLDQLQLSGTELSTLDISNNRALGYGYLIAIVPSKLQVVTVTWSGNTSNVAALDTTPDAAQELTAQRRGRRRRGLQQAASTSGSGSAPGWSSGSSALLQLQSLTDQPLFSVTPGSVFDKDTQDNRAVLNYHITTHSNKPMDIPILLLDALDQIASENTTLRQAQVRARLTEASNGCKAELLGGYEATARNGTALMVGMRLRALKGENYSIEFRVEDAVTQGTVEPLVVNVTVPPCSIGEIPRDDGYLCQKCDQRSFSLWQDTEPLLNCTYPDLHDIICYPCPDGAECLGGAVMVPRQGFWHSAANSTFMNACPNPDACRDGDDEAQELLVACQEWWYSRPQGFDYQAFVESVLTAGAGTGDWFDPTAPPGLNVSDPSLCVLWGLPYTNPASYMHKQCAAGYQGNLCAVCAPVDGVLYANGGEFECQACFNRAASITIAILGFLANVVTVLVTIVVTFMTDYTEEEELGVGDLLKELIVHMQYFVIVTRLNIDWPISISFVTSICSAFTGAVSKVYSPSCLLDASASPDDYAAADQLAAIIMPLLTTLCAAGLWMIIRLILFNFNSTAQTEQKLDMRTIDEYKADRARRIAERKRIRESKILRDVGGAEDVTPRYDADSMYGAYAYDAYADLRASELIPGAAAIPLPGGGGGGDGGDGGGDGGDGGGGGVGANQLAESELARALSPPRQGETYRGDPQPADMSTVHIGLPILEAAVAGVDEGVAVAAVGGGELGEAGRLRSLGSASTELKPSAGQGWPETAEGAGEEEVGERDGDGISCAATSPGSASGRRTKAFLPLPPRENNLSPATPIKASPPSQPRPPAPPPPPPPSPPPPPLEPRSPGGHAEEGGRGGSGGGGDVGDDCGGGGGRSSRRSTASGSVVVSAVATITTHASPSAVQSVPPPPTQQTVPASPFSAAAYEASRSPRAGTSPLRSPSNSRRVLPARGSVDGAETAERRQLPGLPISPASSLRSVAAAVTLPRTSCGARPGGPSADDSSYGGFAAGPSEDRFSAGGPAGGKVNVRSSDGVVHPPRGAGRAAYANLTVRPAVPSSSCRSQLPVNGEGMEEGDEGDPERGEPGSDAGGGGARGGAGRGGIGNTGRGDSAREGAGGGGSGGNKASGFLSRKLTQGSNWFRTFFTYDEAAAEEGQVRWASLANIHRTMVWWRQMLLVVMIACFVLYPAWAQATLQIFACYYLDDGSGYYPEFQLAQWGRGYWILNMNQECYLGDHARIWVPIGIVCIFIICIGIPFLNFMVTWTHRTALRTVHVVQTYGFLYQRYDYDTFYWWEAAIQAQTLMLVVVDVFGRVLVVYQQAVLLMLALMAIMWSNMYFQPLKHKLLGRMSALSLATLSFTVALGMFFVPPVDRKDPVTKHVAAVIGALIVAMNVALPVYFAYIMWTQGRRAIDRSVAAARQRMLTATSKMQMGITVVRQHMSSASQNLRSVTSRSLSMVWDKVHVRRRTGSTPPITPRA